MNLHSRFQSPWAAELSCTRVKVAETQEAAKGNMAFGAESRLQTADANGSNKQVVACEKAAALRIATVSSRLFQ